MMWCGCFVFRRCVTNMSLPQNPCFQIAWNACWILPNTHQWCFFVMAYQHVNRYHFLIYHPLLLLCGPHCIESLLNTSQYVMMAFFFLLMAHRHVKTYHFLKSHPLLLHCGPHCIESWLNTSQHATMVFYIYIYIYNGSPTREEVPLSQISLTAFSFWLTNTWRESTLGCHGFWQKFVTIGCIW